MRAKPEAAPVQSDYSQKGVVRLYDSHQRLAAAGNAAGPRGAAEEGANWDGAEASRSVEVGVVAVIDDRDSTA